MAKQTGLRPPRAAQHGVALVIAGWPADHWAGQVYPNLESARAKRRLAADLLRFCRLTDADGDGTSGWTKHLQTLSAARRS